MTATSMTTYCDQLRTTMEQCGLSVSPVVKHEDRACLRFDALEVTDTVITFLWLGKPVHMVRRNDGHLAHVTGEMVLDLH